MFTRAVLVILVFSTQMFALLCFADTDAEVGFTIANQTPAASEKMIASDLQYPANIYQLDRFFAHHLLIVEKATHRLHLFRAGDSNEGFPSYLQSYVIATGQTSGDKSNSGDLKTPEGIYQLINFLPNKELLRQYGNDGKKYGIGAFVLDYPNLMDRKLGKTGGGIWLHSTDDESRLLKGLDSKGCVVVGNQNLKDISQYIELEHTPIIIVQDLFFLRKETWNNNREMIRLMIQDWLDAWKKENLDRYIGHYHYDFKDPIRGNFRSFRAYKQAVFQNPGRPVVDIDNLSILAFGDYAVVNLRQIYKSNTIDDIGRKTLYLKKNERYQWKIIAEQWSSVKSGRSHGDEFTPSMRFFK
ncbi:MAG: L,D-transpeptidase family protein [Oligoflexia bacterium]|nr:L,D-transpeptidase family protein [Oligoflexia bacterium]